MTDQAKATDLKEKFSALWTQLKEVGKEVLITSVTVIRDACEYVVTELKKDTSNQNQKVEIKAADDPTEKPKT